MEKSCQMSGLSAAVLCLSGFVEVLYSMSSCVGLAAGFRVPHYAAKNGQALYVVGSIAELGSWQYSAGVRLAQDWNDAWTAEVVLPPTARGALEYKVD
jgi:hypothetical protein